eukprot:268574-Alexandrium_andersonii.AAC.1
MGGGGGRPGGPYLPESAWPGERLPTTSRAVAWTLPSPRAGQKGWGGNGVGQPLGCRVAGNAHSGR